MPDRGKLAFILLAHVGFSFVLNLLLVNMLNFHRWMFNFSKAWGFHSLSLYLWTLGTDIQILSLWDQIFNCRGSWRSLGILSHLYTFWSWSILIMKHVRPVLQLLCGTKESLHQPEACIGAKSSFPLALSSLLFVGFHREVKGFCCQRLF